MGIRQIVSLAVALVLCVGLMPAAAWAADDPLSGENAIYLDSWAGNDANDGATAKTAVKTLKKACDRAQQGETIYICNLVELKNASETNLDGYSFKRSLDYKGALFRLVGTTKLTLVGVTVDGNKAEVPNTENDGSHVLFEVAEGATLVVDEGSRLVNNASGGIAIMSTNPSAPSTVNMEDGEISGIEGVGAYGGAVFVQFNGVFNLNGGSIKNNSFRTDYGEGGGVYIQGKAADDFLAGRFIMNGGAIEDNVLGTGRYGGGISNRGYAELNGGEIKNNSAGWGAGVATVEAGHTVLNGAVITGNTTLGNGGGVYVEGFTGLSDVRGAVFEMKSGSVTGNEAWNGGAIMAYHWQDDTMVKISGGTISDNSSDDGGDVTLGGDLATYAKLELSGSPTISGDVLLRDNNPVVDVVGAFTPTQPVELSLRGYASGGKVVNYAPGVTPSSNAFTVQGSSFVMNADGTLAALIPVTFADGWGTEQTENIVENSLIDPALVPAFSKPGYKFDGWVAADGLAWDVAKKPIGTTPVTLTADWTLDAPTASIEGELTVPFGSRLELTAVAAHPASGITLSYQWYRDGAPIVGQQTSVLSASEGGRYSVKVTASDGVRTSEATVEVEASVESAPARIDMSVDDASEGDAFDPLKGVVFSDASGNPVDLSSVSVKRNDVNADVPGTYRVVYEVSRAVGNPVEVERIVRVHGKPRILTASQALSMRVGSPSTDALGTVKAGYMKAGPLAGDVPKWEDIAANSAAALLAQTGSQAAVGLSLSMTDAAGNPVGAPTKAGRYAAVLRAANPYGGVTEASSAVLVHGLLRVSVSPFEVKQNDAGSFDVARLMADAQLSATVERAKIDGAVEVVSLPASAFAVAGSVDVSNPGTYELRVTATDAEKPVTSAETKVIVTVKEVQASIPDSNSKPDSGSNKAESPSDPKPLPSATADGVLARTADFLALPILLGAGAALIAGAALMLAARKDMRRSR